MADKKENKTDKKENKTDKKEKKSITEKIIKKIKNYAGSIEDFLEGSSTSQTGEMIIGKQKEWGVEKKSSGGRAGLLQGGIPKLAKKGWK